MYVAVAIHWCVWGPTTIRLLDIDTGRYLMPNRAYLKGNPGILVWAGDEVEEISSPSEWVAGGSRIWKPPPRSHGAVVSPWWGLVLLLHSDSVRRTNWTMNGQPRGSCNLSSLTTQSLHLFWVHKMLTKWSAWRWRRSGRQSRQREVPRRLVWCAGGPRVFDTAATQYRWSQHNGRERKGGGARAIQEEGSAARSGRRRWTAVAVVVRFMAWLQWWHPRAKDLLEVRCSDY